MPLIYFLVNQNEQENKIFEKIATHPVTTRNLEIPSGCIPPVNSTNFNWKTQYVL